MKKSITQEEWLGLSQELRDKLKEVFAINRSEGKKVVNNKLVSDGCSQGDLIAGITIGKMIEYLGDTSFAINTDDSERLFDDLFKRVSVIYLASFFIVALILFLIQKAPWNTDLLLALKRTIIVTFPSSLGSTIAGSLK